jgi:hypothetical protein
MAKRWLKLLLSMTAVFNMLDAAFTLFWVQMGMATEANPLMAAFLNQGPVAFMCAKLAMVSFCLLLLWRARRAPMATWGGCGVFATYSFLMCYHFTGLMG